MFVHSDTFEGDSVPVDILRKFLKGYLAKFGTNKAVTTGNLLEDVSLMKRFELPLTKADTTDPDGERVIYDIAGYTLDFLGRELSLHYWAEYYGKEWQGYHSQSYYIGQYNAMKMVPVVKYLINTFVRKQLFQIHSRFKDDYMRKQGRSSWITSMNEIDQYGISDPDPIFAGVKKDPMKLTTQQPDIHQLYPLLVKYELVEFVQVADYYASRYKGYDDARMLHILNVLKYEHLNVKGNGRKVLDIQSKQLYHSACLEDKDIVGKRGY